MMCSILPYLREKMGEIVYKIVLTFIQLWRLFYSLCIHLFKNRIQSLILRDVFTKSGIQVNGPKPHDIQIHNENFYTRLALDRELGLGESYMEGWWDCADIPELFKRLAGTEFYNYMKFPWDTLIDYLKYDLFNMQTAKRSMEVIDAHYDLGNVVFESFLDPAMVYSCGYWKNAQSLEEAQEQKMNLIARKLKLEPGMRILDIGCGWGGLCKFLAEKYKVTVVGLTISKEGAQTAIKRCVGLKVDIRLQDYRQLSLDPKASDKYDRIVCIGMMEHVGHRNFNQFFRIVQASLKTHGLFLLQTITIDNDTVWRINGWFNKYIFPNGCLPLPQDITMNVNRLFSIEDWHNFGTDYAKTLRAWNTNFVKNWPLIQHHFGKNAEKAYRMWTYYFLHSAGGFASTKWRLTQIVLSKGGRHDGYESVR